MGAASFPVTASRLFLQADRAAVAAQPRGGEGARSCGRNALAVACAKIQHLYRSEGLVVGIGIYILYIYIHLNIYSLHILLIYHTILYYSISF